MEKLKACAGPVGKKCPKKAKIRDVAHWLRCPECREVQRRVNNAALDKARYERVKAGLRAGSVDPQHRSKVDLRKARETTQGITPAVTSQAAWCRQLQQVANLCLSVLLALLFLTGCENTCRPCFVYGPDRAPGFRWTTDFDAACVHCTPCSEAKSPEALKLCGKPTQIGILSAQEIDSAYAAGVLWGRAECFPKAKIRKINIPALKFSYEGEKP